MVKGLRWRPSISHSLGQPTSRSGYAVVQVSRSGIDYWSTAAGHAYTHCTTDDPIHLTYDGVFFELARAPRTSNDYYRPTDDYDRSHVVELYRRRGDSDEFWYYDSFTHP